MRAVGFDRWRRDVLLRLVRVCVRLTHPM